MAIAYGVSRKVDEEATSPDRLLHVMAIGCYLRKDSNDSRPASASPLGTAMVNQAA